MKKLFSFGLVLCLLFTALVSCGGGDTNMHKIMAAVEDGLLGTDGEGDVYHYKTSDATPFTSGVCINENYSFVKMYAKSNGHTGHRVDFHLSALTVVKDGHYEQLKNTTVCYNGDDNTIIVNGFDYNWRNWNSKSNKWEGDDLFKSYYTDSLVFDMNVYYTNGKFTADDAVKQYSDITTSLFERKPDYEDTMLTFVISVLNKGLEGLDGIYSQKGYPIKSAQQ